MLANMPNGKVSEALAQIYTKEGISLSKPKDGKGAAGKAGEGGGGGEEDEEFTPVVYVAEVREKRAGACSTVATQFFFFKYENVLDTV